MSETVVSTKLSELNATQLSQLINIVKRQQDERVTQSQDIGMRIDDLRAARAKLGADIAKANSNLVFLAKLLEARQAV